MAANREERDKVRGFQNSLNDVVRAAAERNGATYVLPDDAPQHSACSDEPWVDFTGQDTDSFPMHPTHAGQVAMAQALRRAL